MSESEWLSCTDPSPMLTFLRDRGAASDRKLRLFAAACCRLIWEHLGSRRARLAVETVERYADGAASDEDLRASQAGAHDVLCRQWNSVRDAAYSTVAAAAGDSAYAAAIEACRRSSQIGFDSLWWPVAQPLHARRARRFHVGAARCLFGNPFRPVAFDPSWRTSTVLGLAGAMYEARSFEDAPILADALEEAGCDDPAVLGHLRGGGTHVRGCWAVDLVLGRV